MDDIYLVDSHTDTLEKKSEEPKKNLPCWKLQIAPKKIQRDSITQTISLQNL